MVYFCSPFETLPPNLLSFDVHHPFHILCTGSDRKKKKRDNMKEEEEKKDKEDEKKEKETRK
jgi:hypothetical protein